MDRKAFMVKNAIPTFILAFWSFGLAGSTNWGVITFHDSTQAKVRVIDTSGCSIVFVNSSGATVSIKKTRVKTFVSDSLQLDFTSFVCQGQTPIRTGMLERSPREILLATITRLSSTKQDRPLNSTVFYCSSVLEDPFTFFRDSVAIALDRLFEGFSRKEISCEDANKILQDSSLTDGYFAVCVSLHTVNLTKTVVSTPGWGYSIPVGGGMHMVSGGGSITLSPKSYLRIVIVSLRDKHIIFDEDDSNEVTMNSFEKIKRQMKRQGLIEKRKR